jgi:hypothetical protein
MVIGTKRLVAPHNKEITIGDELQISPEYTLTEARKGVEEINSRKSIYRLRSIRLCSEL